ncbi:MAG: SRPBCC domain-containing protein [Acidobacteriota bacterium]
MKPENPVRKRAVSHEAPVERVWEALTDGKELKRWFPLEARVQPGKGGSVWMSWKNEYAGESAIAEWEPNRHLRITWGEADNKEPLQEAWARLDLREIVATDRLEPFIEDAPYQFAAVLPNLANSLVRVSVDPSMADPQAKDVTLWLACYGVSPEQLRTISKRWLELLERRFPEGTSA